MVITVLTLFPEIFPHLLEFSVIKRAVQKNLIDLRYVNIRDFAHDNHKSVDDHPFGGGVGMVMRVDVIYEALQSVFNRTDATAKPYVILLDPRGKKLKQSELRRLSAIDNIVLICGHYEGIDERILEYTDEVISLGDFVVTGGELPAMMVIDGICRLVPGVLKKSEATMDESFETNLDRETPQTLLSYPQYTKPREFRALKVPDVLISGDHAKIHSWRKSQAKKITRKLRPDLLLK